ncbi:hypothetical protein CW306_10725 [Bacillus sp. BA3]|nr:hypothetical protein CW306_10725 [Bacillus sp. BA3]
MQNLAGPLKKKMIASNIGTMKKEGKSHIIKSKAFMKNSGSIQPEFFYGFLYNLITSIELSALSLKTCPNQFN